MQTSMSQSLMDGKIDAGFLDNLGLANDAQISQPLHRGLVSVSAAAMRRLLAAAGGFRDLSSWEN